MEEQGNATCMTWIFAAKMFQINMILILNLVHSRFLAVVKLCFYIILQDS